MQTFVLVFWSGNDIYGLATLKLKVINKSLQTKGQLLEQLYLNLNSPTHPHVSDQLDLVLLVHGVHWPLPVHLYPLHSHFI